jgi:very-short-patch-repair endonuclease
MRLYPGVYGLGTDVITQRGKWFAGVLAGGPGTTLSHRSAAACWGLLDEGPRVEVTRHFNWRPEPGLAPGCVHPGLWLRRTRWLPREHLVERAGLPVMSVERLLLSLAATVSFRELESALGAASRAGMLDSAALDKVLARGPGWRGIGNLKRLAATVRPADSRSRSFLEDRFIAGCHEGGLPAPRVNEMVEGLEVDLLWEAPRLIVELDGFEFHRDRLAFERDRERDALLLRSGYRVLRFTYRAVDEHIGDCIETVRSLLARTADDQSRH